MSTPFAIHETPAGLIESAAQKIVKLARESIAARGSFSLALAGGSTPRALYELLASAEYQSEINWQKTQIFFGDERAVSPDDELSNFKMAQTALLSKIPIPAENVHPMEAERKDLEHAAREYEAILKTHFPLDLVLLGMGDDGHTASLFPHSPVLDEAVALCAATPVATLEPHVRRLTLTFPAINAARHVWILVTGQSKAARLQQVLEGAPAKGSTPVAGVHPQNGELLWMLDRAAARLCQNLQS